MHELIQNIEKLHTTPMGIERIRRNLSLGSIDAVEYCRGLILCENAQIVRRGKNFYARVNGCEITVNAFSFTIITAHKIKADDKSQV